MLKQENVLSNVTSRLKRNLKVCNLKFLDEPFNVLRLNLAFWIALLSSSLYTGHKKKLLTEKDTDFCTVASAQNFTHSKEIGLMCALLYTICVERYVLVSIGTSFPVLKQVSVVHWPLYNARKACPKKRWLIHCYHAHFQLDAKVWEKVGET